MKNSFFFHPLMKPVQYKHKTFLQVTGLNFKTQFFIQQTVEWSASGHRYSEKQVEDLEQEEVKWICKGKQIGKNNYEYLTLTKREDLLFHLSPKKGSILSYYLSLIQNEIEISDYVIQMNVILEKISFAYNQVSGNQGINLNYQIKPLQIKDINSTYLESFINQNHLHSLEFMSNDNLFKELLKILEIILQQSEKYYLLNIENIATLLQHQEIENILYGFYRLSQEYQLNVISFAKNEHELLVNEDLIDSILICGDTVNQLEDYDSLEGYIVRNYPTLDITASREILNQIRKVSPYLLSQSGSVFMKDPNDQVFFILINKAMGFSEYSHLKLRKISKLEWNYLEDNLYKSS